jgi:pimeloyl-ACP methyl ester carboxylesterase
MRILSVLVLTCLSLAALADGPQDNLPDKVRRVPPSGVALPDGDRAELQKSVDDLGKEIDDLRNALKGKQALLDLMPDVQVFQDAVRYALKYDEFYDLKEVPVARKLLKEGFARAKQLRDGKPAWTSATGLVVRGYVSKIDGSVQPYGLVVPASYTPNTGNKHRLDFWCHGRGEKLTELSFVNQRMSSAGEFTPPDAFVVHLYGRYCNANKFAGEVDLFEAYDSVRKHYPIDENRLVIRGFSMGGAACWQFAVHFPSMWAAAAPGAGFAETPEFLDFFQKEKVKPTWYEEKLWHLYNSTDYAVNLFNCPTVAYSGEIDSQKQAADVMAREMAKEGLKLVHLIGPKTGHKYHPETRAELNRLIDAIVAKGRNNLPEKIRFTTWTLRYNRSFWVQVDGLGEHWKRARVNASLEQAAAPDGPVLNVETVNVTALTIDSPPRFLIPAVPGKANKIRLDGQVLVLPDPAGDGSLRVHFRQADGKWKMATPEAGTLAKRHGLQGPIDDAFWDRFVMVRPTGAALNDKVGKWAKAETAHALDHWRRQFRGEALVKDDTDITDADIASSNLVLWGDPSSNKVLAKIADKLPMRWDAAGVAVGAKKFDAAHHVPVLVYPNPLNPKKYVVLNSGFTFREYDYLNNARQVPRLPDFVVIDVDVPVSSRWPGGIVAAGFFDARWQLPAAK